MITTFFSIMTLNIDKKNADFYIGLSLALLSTIFIGSSFIIKKIGLQRLTHRGSLRAGAGGFGYLKEWIWWLGLITMGIGELANFGAYALAPASLVSPLGALSILITSVLASKCLNEKLNILGKLGCVLCILGSTIIVIHSPREESITDVSALLLRLKSGSFILYAVIVISLSLLIAFHLGPHYGDQNVVIYILLCSSIGSLTVILCKALGLALKDSLHSSTVYIFFFLLCCCLLAQMNYLNKSLDLFNTNIVTPVYYVFFTTFVIIASSIVFNEWRNLRAEDILGNLCGFSIIIIAIFMLNVFKDLDVAVGGLLRQKPSKYHGYQNV